VSGLLLPGYRVTYPEVSFLRRCNAFEQAPGELRQWLPGNCLRMSRKLCSDVLPDMEVAALDGGSAPIPWNGYQDTFLAVADSYRRSRQPFEQLVPVPARFIWNPGPRNDILRRTSNETDQTPNPDTVQSRMGCA
jgi:hypothetical protein